MKAKHKGIGDAAGEMHIVQGSVGLELPKGVGSRRVVPEVWEQAETNEPVGATTRRVVTFIGDPDEGQRREPQRHRHHQESGMIHRNPTPKSYPRHRSMRHARTEIDDPTGRREKAFADQWESTLHGIGRTIVIVLASVLIGFAIRGWLLV